MYVRLWWFVAVVMYEVVEEAEKVVGVIKVRGTKISGTNDETKPQRLAVASTLSV